MPEEAAAPTPAAPEENPSGTPDPAAPASGAPAEPNGDGSLSDSPQDTDWKQRYEDLRPEADRRQSLLADIEGRNGPERQAEALQQHAGVSLEDDEDEFDDEGDFDDEFDEDLRDPEQEIDEIRDELRERDEAQAEAEFQQRERAFIETTVDQLEQEHNVELSDREYKLVVNDALAHRDEHTGEPDLKGAMEALLDSQKGAQKRYGKSKRDVDVPPEGAEGEQKIDFRDKEARQKAGREAFERHQRGSEDS